MREIGYNSQINNIPVNGIGGSSQCFATSAWMFLSFYCDKINAEDDKALSEYVKDVTAHGAQREYEWTAQQTEIQKHIHDAGVAGIVKIGIDLDNDKGLLTVDQLKLLLLVGPVIIGTKKMAGLPGGHIILAVDYNDDGIICNDPYGNALTHYADKNGKGVVYPVSMFDAQYPEGPIRAIWLEV